jgi:uncharacterized protein (DUF885 family)
MHFTLQDRIDEYTFKMYLNPLQADQGFHLDLNYKIKPILNYSDARAYLNTLNAIPLFAQEHFVLLRKGLREEVSQPRVIFKGYEATYNNHIVEDFKKSPFYRPFEKLPDNIPLPQRDSVLRAAKRSKNSLKKSTCLKQGKRSGFPRFRGVRSIIRTGLIFTPPLRLIPRTTYIV